MARKSDGEKIDELDKVVASLVTRMDGVTQEIRDIEVSKIVQRLAVLEAEVADLKKWRDESRRLGWSIVIPILTAIAGAVFAYILKRSAGQNSLA